MDTGERQSASAIINPYYAIDLSDSLFEAHEIRQSKEDWVTHSLELIDENGTEAWLRKLLDVLRSDSGPLVQEMMNPFKAITFSARLQGKHEPITKIDAWVQANLKLMKELGSGAWLWQLLEVLETGGPK
jgi:hypothetical protein